MFRRPIVLAFAVCTLALALMQGRAEAQSEPFKITGGGIAPDGLPFPGQPSRSHWSVGVGTHLGKYSGDGYLETDTAVPHDDGTITGEFGSASPYLLTAANGDVLACYYGRTDHGATTPGTFELVPAPEVGPGYYVGYFVAQFVPDAANCTGKFAGVKGRWTMYAMTAPFLLGSDQPIAYVWHGEGTLIYSHGH
jgi:hypothetical protein